MTNNIDNKEKLQKLLREIFQFDSKELDFGIYKILNHKRKEIEKFINDDLIEEITNQLKRVDKEMKSRVNKELTDLKKDLVELKVVDYENNPKYKEKKKELDDISISENLEREIYNHTITFFFRYYDKGDFMRKKRYGNKERYQIQYNGQEILLHWANNDQYYIKTTESFHKFSFKISNMIVNFLTKDVEEENGNNKSPENKFFVLAKEHCDSKKSNLNINFEYRRLKDKEKKAYGTKQDGINKKIVKILEKELSDKNNFKELFQKKDEVTPLSKNLSKYTKKNTMDYFIHKDLKGFLYRELDFYIKNEILNISDIAQIRSELLGRHILKIKVLHDICTTIIQFLAQIEDFQKKLWEKKKFVLKTDYVLTVGIIPDKFYVEIFKNKKQKLEWKKIFSVTINSHEDLNEEINQKLPVDTAYFSNQFKENILNTLSKKTDLNQLIKGNLINSENFNGLNLLYEKFKKKIKCIYIDPPYNTKNDGFLYKDNYQKSSWLTLMQNRLNIAKKFLSNDGTIAVSIDNNEIDDLLKLMDGIFGFENRRTIITVKRSSVSGPKVINPGVVNILEYLVIYSNNSKKWNNTPAYREKERDGRYNQFLNNRKDNYEQWGFVPLLDKFAEFKKIPKSNLKKRLGVNYELELSNFVKKNSDSVCRWAAMVEGDIAGEANKLRIKSLDHPKKIFQLKREGYSDYYIRNGQNILWVKDRLKNIGNKYVFAERVSDIWDDVLPNDLHNEGGGVVFRDGKKPEKLIERLFQITTNENDVILDFFAGTGTSAAVAHKLNRKYVNIETAEYFKDKLLIRLKNTLFGEQSGISNMYDWKGGGVFQYQKLEQYEDTLENIEFSQKKLEGFSDYFIRYMLDFETRKSNSFLNIDNMEDPFNYKIKIMDNYEQKSVSVDLVETYNYLVGLHLESLKTVYVDKIKYLILRGKIGNKTAVIIWRNTKKINLTQDRDFIQNEISNEPFDEVHINGNNLVENAILIEEQFARLMMGDDPW